MRRRTRDDILTCLGTIEASIAAVEQATTRSRFAMARLPEDDDGLAHRALLDTLEAYEACVTVLLAQQKIALWDLDAVQKRDGQARSLRADAARRTKEPLLGASGHAHA